MRRKRTPHSVDDLDIKENALNKFKDDSLAASYLEVFANTLNNLMTEKGIDQKTMAADLNISTGALSGYRNGTVEPKLITIIKMASYLEVDCSYLMTGVSSATYRVNKDLGLSTKAVELLSYLNKNETIDQGRTLSFLNRVLSEKPGTPCETIFTYFEMYVRSGQVEQKLEESSAEDPKKLSINVTEKETWNIDIPAYYRAYLWDTLKNWMDRYREQEEKKNG